jgi:hypothetical protein
LLQQFVHFFKTINTLDGFFHQGGFCPFSHIALYVKFIMPKGQPFNFVYICLPNGNYPVRDLVQQRANVMPLVLCKIYYILAVSGTAFARITL